MTLNIPSINNEKKGGKVDNDLHVLCQLDRTSRLSLSLILAWLLSIDK